MEIVYQQEGMGLDRVFVNELKLAVVVVKGVKGSMGEGAELLNKIRKENEGIKVTPRWPWRIGVSNMMLEVKSVKKEIRIINEVGKVIIDGKVLKVEHYQPPERTKEAAPNALAYTPKGPALDAPKGPRARVPARKLFAEMAANAGYIRGDGCTIVGGLKNVRGICRNCARTGHLERACPQRMKVR